MIVGGVFGANVSAG